MYIYVRQRDLRVEVHLLYLWSNFNETGANIILPCSLLNSYGNSNGNNFK